MSNLRLTCKDDDVMFHWHESSPKQYHPVMLSTVRCHARIDHPTEPSFVVEGNEVYTVPGRYCGNMYVCHNHESEGRTWGRTLVGRLVPKDPPQETDWDFHENF